MRKWHSLRFALLVVVCALTACSTVQTPSEADPFEGFNRTVFQFNQTVDRVALKPIAKTYNRALPQRVKASVTNFFANIGDFYTMANDLLQGNVKAGAEDMMRITINSVFGIAGLFDVATEAGMAKHQQDFGQTLGYYGVHSGPYLVLPLLGPSTVRDTAGFIVDRTADPTTYIHPHSVSYSLYALRLVNTRAFLLRTTNLLASVAFDQYAFERDAFLQHRRYLIQGASASFDYEDDDDELATDEAGQPQTDTMPNHTDLVPPPPNIVSRAAEPVVVTSVTLRRRAYLKSLSATAESRAASSKNAKSTDYIVVPPAQMMPPFNYFPGLRFW